MRLTKKWQLLSLLFLTTVSINGYSNSNVQADLDKAKSAGKAVFVVVTGNGATNADKAVTIAKEAKGIYKNSEVIQLNRDEVSNADFVTKFRLAGAPVPLILVLSPKGVPVGGYLLEQATAKDLVNIIPSPKLDEIYGAMNTGKSSIIVLSKKSYLDKSKIVAKCKEAKNQLNDKAEIIEIDVDDAKEADTLKKLNAQMKPNTTSTIVINAAGQTTGSFDGAVETNQLVLAANKVVKSSGCCGRGSGASCGPKK